MKPLLIDKKSVLTNSINIKEVDQFYLNSPFHFHDAYEMVLILKSNGRRIVGNNIENFNDGDLVLMGPDLPHAWYNENEYYLENTKLKVQALVVYFYPDWLKDNLLSAPELARLRQLLENSKRGLKITGETKRQITEQIISLASSSGLTRIILLLTILDQLCKTEEYIFLATPEYLNTFNQKTDIDRIDKVYQYVLHNYKEKLKLEDIANITCMTPTAFCKFFKARTEKTFTNFVNEVRIGQACKLLYERNISISEICFECGFNNFTHFNQIFKAITKMTPTEYKAKIGVATFKRTGS